MPHVTTEPPSQIADLTGDAEAVIDWLADEDGGRAAFNIGEHYAPYPTEVNAERIRIAAEALDEAASSGKLANIPDCPMVDAATMRAVLDLLDRRESVLDEVGACRRVLASGRGVASWRKHAAARLRALGLPS